MGEALRKIDAVVAGYLCVDMAPEFEKRKGVSYAGLLRPGKLIETKGLHFSLGGAVANTGLAMKKFRQKTVLMGCVGNDNLGDLTIARLTAAGVKSGVRRTTLAGTAYSIVIAPPGTDRIFLINPGCNKIFTAKEIDYGIVKKSRLFHFGYPPLMEGLWMKDGAELKKLLKKAKLTGAVVSLDMALPDPDSSAGKANWRKILSGVLPLVDIFSPSIEELIFMLEPKFYYRILKKSAGGDLLALIAKKDYARIAEKIIAMGVKILLIKGGHKGAYLRTGNLKGLNSSALRLSDRIGSPEGNWLKAFPVEAGRFRNASGAGDCAIAGFLTALLKDKTIIQAGKFAMMAGRDNLYGQDALSGLADWPRMEKLL